MTTNNTNPITQLFAANPVLVDAAQVAVVNSTLAAFDEPDGKMLLSDKMNNDDDYWSWGAESNSHPYRPYKVTNGILQIPVQGTLLNKFDYQFGRWATGYQYIEKAVKRGVSDPEVKGIALMIDSPGGEVSGCFELCDKIYNLRDEKPIRAFAADAAYSAAYAIASSASDITVTRSGGTGSVGVVTMHVSYEDALTAAGLEVTFIFAGDHKVEGNPYQKLSGAAKDRIQDRIDKLYGVFTGTVARNRDLDEDAVRGTQALTFDSEASVENGFADRVGSIEDEMVAFSEDTSSQAKGNQMTTFTQEQMDAAVATAVAQAETAAATATASAVETAKNDGVKAEQDRRAAILGSEHAKTKPKTAQLYVDKNLDSATAIELLEAAPAEQATKTEPKKPAASNSPFDKHMSGTEQPEVGADAPQIEATDDDKATAGIVGAAKAFKGVPQTA